MNVPISRELGAKLDLPIERWGTIRSAVVHYIFEIPLLVAKSITGFKHDEVCPHVVGNEFKIMKKESQQGGLFSRLFGKK